MLSFIWRQTIESGEKQFVHKQRKEFKMYRGQIKVTDGRVNHQASVRLAHN